MSPIVPEPMPLSILEDRRQGEVGRAGLIQKFNDAVGIAGSEIARLQNAFIDGTMPFEEAIAYERYCRYMIGRASSTT